LFIVILIFSKIDLGSPIWSTSSSFLEPQPIAEPS
jgi:hypothetical protein